MLTADERAAAVRRCYEECYWTPCWPSSILAVGLEDAGFAGGVYVPVAKGARKYQAIAVAVNQCEWVKLGDLICFDIGRGEELRTVRGEILYHITEQNVSSVDDNFWDAAERQTESGLWVAM